MITIVDYGMGNLKSVYNAFRIYEKNVAVSSDPKQIAAADGVILPGVGAFFRGMDNIRELGLIDTIRDVAARKVPLLGICLGMQLFFEHSDEHGGSQGLGLVKGNVLQFQVQDLKVPQMGWNTVRFARNDNPLFADIDSESYFYFAHSFYVNPADTDITAGITEYGISYTSSIRKETIYGTQFHPEKSSRDGLQIVSNFCDIVNKKMT